MVPGVHFHPQHRRGERRSQERKEYDDERGGGEERERVEEEIMGGERIREGRSWEWRMGDVDERRR